MASSETSSVQQRQLGRVNGGLTVSALGLGCMGMSEFYGPRDDAQSLQTLHRSLDLGVSFLDSADTYGLGHNEELIGRLIAERGRDNITIASKFGIQRQPGAYARSINNQASYVREACEASLHRLGTDHIDLYYIHRVDVHRPIEEPMQALAALVREGKIRHVGICEVSSATLRRAHKVHPLTALQTEYSLWTRDPEDGVLDTCRELGVGLVPYSPLGRGFLTGALDSTDELAEDDFRRANPRFSEQNFAANRKLVKRIQTMAEDKGCTTAQLALAWVLAQGDDVVPIPGTRRIPYLEENASTMALKLSDEELHALEEAVPRHEIKGERYTEEGMKGLDA